MSDAKIPAPPIDQAQKRREWRLFIFIIVFLFPILSVIVVGGFGFAVWMSQIVLGPPGAG